MTFKNVNEENFKEEVLDHEGFVLVDFWAEWCIPCRTMLGNLGELEEELDGEIKIVKAEPFVNSSLADMYHIRSVPTLILFKDGEIVDRKSGGMNKHTLTQWVSSLL